MTVFLLMSNIMIYTHTVQSRTFKERKSPLDMDAEQVRFDKTEGHGR